MSKPCPLYGKAVYLDCMDCEDKQCKTKPKPYKEICIGVDESYANTGISIVADGKLLKVKSLDLSKCRTNSDKRARLRRTLDRILLSCTDKSESVVCVIERIRTFSKGFISTNYIESIGALNAVIVDTCFKYGVQTYSVDTRCWKSQVVGSSKPKPNEYGVPDEKWPTVEWLIAQGMEQEILLNVTNSKKEKGTFTRDGKKYMYNNDAADSAAIAMFWFVGEREKLKLEK